MKIKKKHTEEERASDRAYAAEKELIVPIIPAEPLCRSQIGSLLGPPSFI